MGIEVIYHNDPSDPLYGQTTTTNHPDPPTRPITLTDKQFRKFAAQQLGSAAAVGAIWKAASASADGDVQFAFMAWSKAQTLEKAEVEQLSAVLVAGGCMTAQQRDKITGANWPEA